MATPYAPSRRTLLAAGAAGAATLALPARSGPTAEIVVGQTMPYSGPASSYSVIGRAEAAYFHKVNDDGGVGGRKLRLLSLDDAYSPPKTVEQTRRLVEREQVAAIFGTFGTPTNAVIRKYLNAQKVPHLFPTGGADQWNDPKGSPWTFGWQPNYNTEMRIYAEFVLAERPQGRIGILYQNDDVGKDNLRGLREGLGAAAGKMIVKEVSYETTDATVDSQVISLREAGVDVFFNAAAGKFAAQAIRKAADLRWKPLQILSNYSSSVAAVLTPGGLDNAKDIVSTQFQKDPNDPRWHKDPGYLAWLEWMNRYLPDGDKTDIFNVYGYLSAQTLVEVLKRCGSDFSREAIRQAAETLRGIELPMLMPGITLNTSPTQHLPIRQLYLIRFDGRSWQSFGSVKGGSA
ncbi:ABC transporter substrate-binding protein [Xenophilus azovorans]|uniref:ABC transporter substrate-binding protein n=1 Tax=Xenophilus azovorans TaxID=151755 RepID=UPI00056F0E97|nr:ABC transporter substrate-binding protein [Xenophilus azovorans]